MNNSTVIQRERSRIEDTTKALVTMLAIVAPVALLTASLIVRIAWLVVGMWWYVPPAIYALIWVLLVMAMINATLNNLLALAARIATLDGVSDLSGTEFVRVKKNHLVRRRFGRHPLPEDDE